MSASLLIDSWKQSCKILGNLLVVQVALRLLVEKCVTKKSATIYATAWIASDRHNFTMPCMYYSIRS